MSETKMGLNLNGIVMAKTPTEYEGKKYYKLEVAAVGVPMIIQIAVTEDVYASVKEGALFNRAVSCKINKRNETKFSLAG